MVVATEGESVDGRLTLIETWAGSLGAEDRIDRPKLSASTLEASLRIHRDGLRVTGARMVLFLDLLCDEATKTWASESDLHADSLCCIEGSKVFAMIGRGSPAGALIGPLRMSERTLRARVLRMASIRDELARLQETADVEVRLTGAANFVNSDDEHFVMREVFEVLASCGKKAVPLLVSHLDGPLDWEACRALAEIGDPSAVGPLVGRVERELLFWQEARDRLVDTSWRGATEREIREYESREHRLHTLLYALARIPSPEYEDVVRRTLKLWLGPPEIREIPYGHINRACSAALRALEHARRATK